MKYVAAYALLVLGGKENPTVDDLKALIKEVGAEVDDAKLKELVDSLHGKKLADVIESGMKQVSTLSVGGGGAPAAQPAQQSQQQQQAKPVETKQPDPEPEEDVDMGGLFD